MKHADTANNVYKFVHKENEWIKTNIYYRNFENEWLKIQEDGFIFVKGENKKGYAWNGCSPKFNFLDLLWGTPDGKISEKMNKPITYYASMFHDILYQFKEKIPMSRKEADIIFLLLLKEENFLWTKIYYWAIRVFGYLYGKWKSEGCNENIKIIRTSYYL